MRNLGVLFQCRVWIQDKGRQGDSLSEEELQLPDERKQALLDFLLAQWTEDTDVGDWNVEEMKMEWDRCPSIIKPIP